MEASDLEEDEEVRRTGRRKMKRRMMEENMKEKEQLWYRQ